jgi:sensor c-di-GMP phosphodiesterase-like protein
VSPCPGGAAGVPLYLFLFYIPIVLIVAGIAVGIRALVRWLS